MESSGQKNPGDAWRDIKKMCHEEVEKFLLHEYGGEYKLDIEELGKNQIDGPQLLELPDEQRPDIKLSLAFKTLITKKAKDVKHKEVTKPPVSDIRKMYPFCNTTFHESSSSEDVPLSVANCGLQSACAPKNAAWTGRSELKVEFLDKIPSHWKYNGKDINTDNIMGWANEWGRGGPAIPHFVHVKDGPSDIRVKFVDSGECSSTVGNTTDNVADYEPTMILDLYQRGKCNDNYKKFVVVHEFGHALGLYHEHQRSDFWNLVRPYIHEKKMKECLGISDAKFKNNWDSLLTPVEDLHHTPYDHRSVMHYWFLPEWLKFGYSIRSNIKVGKNLTKQVADVLLGIHDFTTKKFPETPSQNDLNLILKLYGASVPVPPKKRQSDYAAEEQITGNTSVKVPTKRPRLDAANDIVVLTSRPTMKYAPPAENQLRKQRRIIITGRTGVGKSALANSILEGNQAIEGDNTNPLPETRNVNSYLKTILGIHIILYDTPGFQDIWTKEEEDPYLRQLQTKCQKFDLNLYCVKMTGGTIGLDEIIALKKLSKTYGMNRFWKNTVFVLTFANKVDQEPNSFNNLVLRWTEGLRKTLISKVNIDKEVAEKVPVIAAGYHDQLSLPNITFWLNNLWNKCVEKIESIAQPVSLEIDWYQRSVAPTCAGALVTRNTQRLSFSPKLQPSEVSQWLRQEFPEQYYAEIEKLREIKINGALFAMLHMEEGQELLEEADLCESFKSLVKSKAEELASEL